MLMVYEDRVIAFFATMSMINFMIFLISLV